ncbi:LysR family transcriptional regulator ArgP [Glaciecola sp. KUL10]|uniref:LysR family transcriptional regulator ArgP n=1 Tax=Glaciecola sp. (strain KUL10) TaxID=2161813 RepID=UPI000D786ABE|nr:LysR family transcriptional regulator ArgP [Glaciecola sp. KUL10]GBL04982.1 LysR family transcriptional regulator, chromosome initiation inhibitor [Glaciecola sp. KUL10]
MIDYKQLQALAFVVKYKGFEKAANQLFITQSAVSRRINQLEAFLGEPVLVRGQPPKPTALGTKLLNHLQQVQQLEVSLGIKNTQQDTEQGPLVVTLATNADSIATWLAEALAAPSLIDDVQISLDISIVDQSVGLKKMKAGEVMICICDSPDPVNGGLSSYLGDMQYQAVASPSFIAKHNIQTINDLSRLPCLVFDQDDHLQHDFLIEQSGEPPQHIHLCPSSEGFKQACIAGLGYGLLPTIQMQDALTSGLLQDLFPGYTLDTPLYWHYWQTESPILKELRLHALNIAKAKLKH